MSIRIDLHHHFEDGAEYSRLDEILKRLGHLEKIMANQNESIAKLKTAFDGMKTAVSAGLANIAGDIKGLQDKLGTLGDLSPENQAIVDGMAADMQGVSDSVQALADVVPDEPVAG